MRVSVLMHVGMFMRMNQLIIMDMRVRFRLPVIEGDTIRVSTWLETLGSASGEVMQHVRRNDDSKLALKSKFHFILVERQTGNSVAIDGDIQTRLLEVIEPKPKPNRA